MQSKKIAVRAALLGLVVLPLFGCGSGSSSGTTVQPVAPVSVPLATAMAYAVNNTLTANTNVTGTYNGIAVTGTAAFTETAAGATTFNGNPALSQNISLSGSLTGNGKTVAFSKTYTEYYNSSYQGLGRSDSSEFDVVQTPYTFPANVTTGDSTSTATLNRYTDNTMTVPMGTIQDSYVVAADGTSTTDALVVFTEKYYDMSNNNTETTQLTFKITTAGMPSLVSATVQTSTSDYTATAD